MLTFSVVFSIEFVFLAQNFHVDKTSNLADQWAWGGGTTSRFVPLQKCTVQKDAWARDKSGTKRDIFFLDILNRGKSRFQARWGTKTVSDRVRNFDRSRYRDIARIGPFIPVPELTGTGIGNKTKSARIRPDRLFVTGMSPGFNMLHNFRGNYVIIDVGNVSCVLTELAVFNFNKSSCY